MECAAVPLDPAVLARLDGDGFWSLACCSAAASCSWPCLHADPLLARLDGVCAESVPAATAAAAGSDATAAAVGVAAAATAATAGTGATAVAVAAAAATGGVAASSSTAAPEPRPDSFKGPEEEEEEEWQPSQGCCWDWEASRRE